VPCLREGFMESTELVDLILERVEAERMFPPRVTRLVKLLYLAEVEYYRRSTIASL
jgi:hypothetical protein